MLNSKKLNSFFNECFDLNIQTTLDPKLLKYYYSLYGKNKEYALFQSYINSTYGKSGESIFAVKDKMIFTALKSIIIRPMYYLFNKLNMDGFIVTPNQLLFGLIEHLQFEKFNSLIWKTYGKMSLFKELEKYINEKEKDQSFVNKPVDKKMRDINNFINLWETTNKEILKANNDIIRSFVFTFIKQHDEYFKNFYIKNIEIATKFFTRRFSGKYILSIDLKKANHQVLRQLGAVKNVSFDDFIEEFTNDPYLKINKPIRQVLYGNLNGGRMGNFQRLIISKLYKFLKEEDSSLEIYIRSDDELIIVFDKDIREKDKLLNSQGNLLKKNILNPVKHLIQLFEEGLKFKNVGIEFNIESYRLLHIETTIGDFFLKEYKDGSFEVKSSDSKYYPQIHKILKGLPITNLDLMFEDKNIKQMVMLANPLKITGGTYKNLIIKNKNFLTNLMNKFKTKCYV